jgi:tetratricopeptide (TPR) repeat protein
MPTLRWNSVSGATTYTVRISGTDWQAETDQTEFKYPGDPVLQPGIDYLLIVEADNGKSSREEDQPGLRFNLLGGEEADGVRADVNRIQALGLSGQAEAFALAQLYTSHELYAEAIELLQESAGLSPQAANVYLALGKLYQHLGLLKDADTAYREAVRIADSVGDLESAAAARAGLGEVYLALGNKDLARDWLSQAQDGFQRLGDPQRAAEIKTQIPE